MPKKEYGWANGNIPTIGDHSLAKHRILRQYVQKYVEILTSNPRIDRFQIALVDGFAGGGIYQRSGHAEPHLGSPAILIEAIAAAELAVRATRQKQIHFLPSYYFVDMNTANVAALEKTLADHVYPRFPGVVPHILTGRFEDQLAPIVADIKKKGKSPRAIFLLDQYGYTAVPLSSLQLIFKELPKAEVFLTLAVGWIAGYLRSVAEAPQVIRDSLGLRESATEEEIEEKLLGGEGSNDKLRVVQKLLHDAFVGESGAKYATPFFIVSRESHRPYWFLHLANSTRANEVVKELHWAMQNHFSHYGDAGLAMLGFDPDREADPSQLSFAFDSFAMQKTERALLEEVPRRVASTYANGVSFDDLFAAVTNETPATKEMLGAALATLCRGGELQKQGGEGQRRHVETAVHGDDILFPSAQGRLPWK